MNGMSKIVRTITNVMIPFVIIYGIYVIAHGHLTPGGGFQGGAVVASGLVLILVSYGSVWTVRKIKEKNLSVIESLGAIFFIILALIGIGIGAGFFNNFLVGNTILFGNIPPSGTGVADVNTGGVIPLMNFAVGLKVIAGLFVIVLVIAYAISKEGTQK